MSPRDDAKARLLATVQGSPSPTRTDVQRRDRVSILGAVVAAALVFAMIGGVKVGARPPALILFSGVVWCVIAGGATALALPRGRSMLGAPRGLLLAGALAVAPLLALTWLCLPFREGVGPGPHIYVRDAVCFAVTLALAAGPLVLFLRLRGDGDPVRPALTGAALGAAAGAWGATLIDLHCEHADLMHVLLGHIAPVMLVAVLGAAWMARRGR